MVLGLYSYERRSLRQRPSGFAPNSRSTIDGCTGADRDTGELVDRFHVINTRAIDLTEALLLLSRADQRSFTREHVDLFLIAEEATGRRRCWRRCAAPYTVAMNRVKDKNAVMEKTPMHVPVSVSTLGAISALLVVALATLSDASGGQDSIFSEAQAYEHFMGRWSRRLALLFVRFAGVRDSDTVLDAGSGTGALTAAVAKVAPSSRIVGIDPTASYVALAQSQHGSRLVLFEVGDAQQMRFDDAMFDRSLSLLVVNFIPDVRKALGEMTRVTKPKRTVAAAVWDYGEGMEMLRAFWDEAVALTPAHATKDERNMPLCRRGDLAALWRGQGLQDVVEEALTIETRFASFDDFWKPFLEKQGPAGAYAASLSVEDREALRLRLRGRLLGTGADKAIVMHARAWAVRGTVP